MSSEIYLDLISVLQDFADPDPRYHQSFGSQFVALIVYFRAGKGPSCRAYRVDPKLRIALRPQYFQTPVASPNYGVTPYQETSRQNERCKSSFHPPNIFHFEAHCRWKQEVTDD